MASLDRSRKALFILVGVPVLVFFLLLGLTRVKIPTVSEFDIRLVEIPDDAPLTRWAEALSPPAEGPRAPGRAVQDLEYRGRRLTLLPFDADFAGALLRVHLARSAGGNGVAVGIVCASKFSQDDLQNLRALDSFARAHDILFLPVTNSPAVATRFLLSPRKTLIYPWIITLVLFGGMSGGFLFALTQASSFSCVLPFSGTRLNMGVLGHMIIGAGTGVVLVALAVKGFGLDLEPLFKWPYGSEGVRAVLQTAAVAIVGGYLGITLLNKVSEQVLKRLENQIEAQNLELADSLALNAKALYSSNLDAARYIKSEDIRKDVVQLAERSNAIKRNALATSLLAEIMRMTGEGEQAIQLYGRAILLLPDKNLRNPQDLFFNRACLLSLAEDSKRIPALIEDLRSYLNYPRSSDEEIIRDPDLAWARSTAGVQSSFSFLTKTVSSTA